VLVALSGKILDTAHAASSLLFNQVRFHFFCSIGIKNS